MRRRGLLFALVLRFELGGGSLLGCGLQQVELAAASGEVIVLDAVPPDAIARLQEVGSDEKVDPMLALDYPADGAAIPVNLAPMTFLFGDDKKMMEPMMMKPPKAGFRAFELRLTGAQSALRIYTSSTRATLPRARWRALLAEVQSDELTIVVRALADDDRVVTSRASKLRVLGATRTGAIAYWNDAVNAAMHATLAGEGATMAGVSDYPTLVPWQSRSGDGSRLASSQDGVLSASIGGAGLTFPWAGSLRVDYPSWSPDGSALALVTTSSGMMRPPAMLEPGTMMRPSDMMEPGMTAEPGTEKSALLQTRVRGASELAEPEALFIADMPNELVRGPSYSPDGRFIAFELAKDKGKAGSLWVVSAQGGAATAVANKLTWKGEGALPTWLPALEGGYWLVFSQNQAPGSAKLPAEQLQLWAAALELGDRATPEAVGEPFWLPFQGPSESNRRALFVAP